MRLTGGPGMTAVFCPDTNVFNDLTSIFADSQSTLLMFSMTYRQVDSWERLRRQPRVSPNA